MNQPIHFSGLNGLRAIAVIAVLFSHTTQALGSFGLDSFVFGKYADGNPKATLLAGYGVSIFFSLSGFLITYLLLAEKKGTTEINIRHFYMRRILRIWPLYYAYFLLVLITIFAFGFSFEKRSILYYLFLSANIPFIFGSALPFLSHYWSLGVEEQFYSFWPWIMKTKKSILKLSVAIGLALIFLKAALRLRDIESNNGELSWLYTFIHVTRFHCMILGAIGAILYFRKNHFFLRITNNLFAQLLSWVVILLAAVNKFHIFSFLDNELVAVITVFLIIGQVEARYRILNLDLFVFDWIGKISFGIYVIHPLIIFFSSKLFCFKASAVWLNYVLVYFSVFGITFVLAYLSYRFFEKIFLRMKGKYSTISSDVEGHK